MRLQSKINIRFLLLSLGIFAGGSVIFYVLLKNAINHEVDESLKNQKAKVERYLKHHQLKDSITKSPDQSVTIKITTQKRIYKKLADTILIDELENEPIPARMLAFTSSSQGKNYEITITQSLIETDDLAEIIFGFMILLFLALIGLLFTLNRWISISAWRPFYESLNKLKVFEIGKTDYLHYNTSNVLEFDRLNQALERMTQKINLDFINLKEFTENASHEIQTPLAIIKSKLELVLQDKSLSDTQHHQIHAAFESANRLSKLNEALLLLSKIENNQFIEKKELDLADLLKTRLEQMEELITMKQIEVQMEMKDSFKVQINPQLAEILINNFLSNAWKHNIRGGTIMISSRPNEIMILNTGEPLLIEPSKIFNRFTKQKTNSESMGLGLAIVKEICNNFNLSLNYTYAEGFHSFILSSNS